MIELLHRLHVFRVYKGIRGKEKTCLPVDREKTNNGTFCRMCKPGSAGRAYNPDYPDNLRRKVVRHMAKPPGCMTISG